MKSPKQVRISGVTHRQASVVAKDLGVPIGEYVDAAVSYFAERGLDPRSIKARESVVIIDEIRKSTDRLFRFLQVQEMGILLPMARVMFDALHHANASRRQSLRTLLTLQRQFDTFDYHNQEGEKAILNQSEAGMDLLLKQLETASKASRRKKQAAGNGE
ncbi:BfmA/BtgA family mobilization protein [Hymenobacter endophyticus]|uniref:BfmA/BtgA family mobilization protein n=1 Tax=Hymenobacter endophyticus TaxID=3076335 RepID=A0ABU3TKX8_9BACT|nr:BfmA/BtgA family mobilization protein [Hymenobacter endophyticus]MDU0372005.1 BfmA/BtgA family mobilization protein [Hymenobacter endophyticus]